jgi:methylenetetrahydrofolate reductase (NADPH)
MTAIAELLASSRTISFEFFPPKTDAEAVTLAATLRDLEPLDPSFVSVTYRGGAASRKRTFDLVAEIKKTTTLEPMAHLICVAHSRAELTEILTSYQAIGVENLMALGGDLPSDPSTPLGELAFAFELVELAQRLGGFSIGVAAHPAGHPRSTSMAEDRDFLAAKLTLADFAITQFFFSLAEYEGLVVDLAARGVNKPVLPGIMPVTSLGSVPRMAQMGAPVPSWQVSRLEDADRKGGKEAVREEGVLLPSSCAAHSWRRGPRVCTSTPSTTPRPRERSPAPSA